MNIFNLFNAFQANPLQMLQKRFNIPPGLNQPDEIINHLLNSGQVTQQQLDQIKNMRNNPMFRQFMK